MAESIEAVKNLENVCVGDKFAFHEKYSRKLYLVECTHVTPKKCIIGNNKYLKSSAQGLGGDTWHRPPTLYLTSPEIMREIVLDRKRKAITECKFAKLSVAAVEQIYDIIEREPTPASGGDSHEF